MTKPTDLQHWKHLASMLGAAPPEPPPTNEPTMNPSDHIEPSPDAATASAPENDFEPSSVPMPSAGEVQAAQETVVTAAPEAAIRPAAPVQAAAALKPPAEKPAPRRQSTHWWQLAKALGMDVPEPAPEPEPELEPPVASPAALADMEHLEFAGRMPVSESEEEAADDASSLASDVEERPVPPQARPPRRREAHVSPSDLGLSIDSPGLLDTIFGEFSPRAGTTDESRPFEPREESMAEESEDFAAEDFPAEQRESDDPGERGEDRPRRRRRRRGRRRSGDATAESALRQEGNRREHDEPVDDQRELLFGEVGDDLENVGELEADDLQEVDLERHEVETPSIDEDDRKDKRRRRRRRRSRRPETGERRADDVVVRDRDRDEDDEQDTDVDERDLEPVADKRPASAADRDSDFDDDAADDEGAARMSHHNIPTWDEAVNLVININMEARAKSGNSHGPGNRGGRDRRGRGR
jgi:hypothetical protein